MNDPFFQAMVAPVGHSTFEYCQSCPQAMRGGFCGARIHPDCLRIDNRGTVRVSLSATAQTWFETIAQFGEVLHLTRNPVAVLGRLGRLPMLDNWQNKALPLPRDGNTRLMPNLAEYASLWAFSETSPLGVVHGLEVRDVSGVVFERVLLPVGANHELFTKFVINYQSPPEEAGSWLSPNHAASASRRATLAGRIPLLRSQWSTGDRNVRRLSPRFVPHLLAAAATAKLQLRTSYYHPALTSTVNWTPEAGGETKCGKALPEFFHGNEVSLHLHRPAIGSVWLWKGNCACCAGQNWAVEVADTLDQVNLAFMAGADTRESDWRELLKASLP
jgi:hypothetical protein